MHFYAGILTETLLYPQNVRSPKPGKCTSLPKRPLFDHDNDKHKSEGVFLSQFFLLRVAVNREHGDVTDALQ